MTEQAAPTAPSLPPEFGQVATPPTSPNGAGPNVTLGDVEVAVYAQRHAYLANRLGRTIGEFVESSDGEITTENFIGFLGGGVYEVLAALIPALPGRMPKHVFAGYVSEEAMDAGTYDPDADRSPTFPQIVSAFEAVWQVNRFDVLGNLGKLVDPTPLKLALRRQMAERLLTTSPSSPAPSGGSDLTSSGAQTPTSPLSGD